MCLLLDNIITCCGRGCGCLTDSYLHNCSCASPRSDATLLACFTPVHHVVLVSYLPAAHHTLHPLLRNVLLPTSDSICCAHHATSTAWHRFNYELHAPRGYIGTPNDTSGGGV
jgi:hypothetical protein